MNDYPRGEITIKYFNSQIRSLIELQSNSDMDITCTTRLHPSPEQGSGSQLCCSLQLVDKQWFLHGGDQARFPIYH